MTVSNVAENRKAAESDVKESQSRLTCIYETVREINIKQNIFDLINCHERHSIVSIAAHSAYVMFSWYRYLIVSLVFSHLGFLEWESFADCAIS